jgi:hypothetical protein
LFGIVVFIIFGIIWIYKQYKEAKMESEIEQAKKNHDYLTEFRLIQQQRAQENERRQAQLQDAPDQKYLDALLVLDAAEHGIFIPGDEEVFHALDEDRSMPPEWENETGTDPAEEYEPPDIWGLP